MAGSAGRGHELTERIELRAIALSDVDAIYCIMADARTRACIPGGARRVGLRDYGRLEPEHWQGEPMHYWADRDPGAHPGISSPDSGAPS
jgi:RimJ/RimL family protein N-acetyltransferase